MDSTFSVLKFFGPNVVVTEGHEWRRHRRLTGPSFSEVRRSFVWEGKR
jgi:cytochrome P450